MKADTESILRAAYGLPEDERIQIIENLISSLEPESDEEVDALWAAEIERRANELEQGKVKAIPWAEVRKEAKRRMSGE